MRVLQAGERVWLVLNDAANRIVYQIEYGPAVNHGTGETLMMYRVDHWVLQRDRRWPLGFYDELAQATKACELSLGMPSFVSPVTAPDGSIVTPAEQQQRWLTGRDPRTGAPRPPAAATAGS